MSSQIRPDGPEPQVHSFLPGITRWSATCTVPAFLPWSKVPNQSSWLCHAKNELAFATFFHHERSRPSSTGQCQNSSLPWPVITLPGYWACADSFAWVAPVAQNWNGLRWSVGLTNT